MEAMNTLCTNLSYCGSDIRTLMFTSRYEHEGKSGIAINVMRTLAGFGKKVLLIDADLRRSTMARHYRFTFEGDNNPGLAQYLAGLCRLDMIYETDIKNAYILPAGRDVINSMQLLASPRFGDLIATLRDSYDMILIDTPPAGVIVDAIEIARHCDGAVLVVGYNTGSGKELGDVTERINRTGCRVLGAVINGVDLKSLRNRRYYYHSGYYSSYYRKYGEKAKKAETKDTPEAVPTTVSTETPITPEETADTTNE